LGQSRQNLGGDDGPTLKDIRDAIIVFECRASDRRDTFDRKVLVAQVGAAASFAKLRRRFTVGCERMYDVDGDRCETKFPCLDAAPLLAPKVS
jgi:hypothetical protein